MTLEKIVVAKFIGIPLLLIDYFYKNFLTPSLSVNILMLIFASYIMACIIVYFYQNLINKHKVNR